MNRTVGSLAPLLLSVSALLAASCLVVTNTHMSSFQLAVTYSGEVTNSRGPDALGHTVRLSFLNEDGAVVTTQEVEPCLRSVTAGASNFFESRVEDIEGPWFSIRPEVVGDSIVRGSALPPGLRVRLTQAEIERDGVLRFRGAVRNDSLKAVDEARICVVVRHESGTVLRVGRIDMGTLAASYDTRFEGSLDVDEPDYRVLRFEAFADALTRGGGLPIAPSTTGTREVDP